MSVVPAHPDEDWLYPTALELIDGVWTVTNPVVEIMVEPMAAVNFIFRTPDGEIPENLGFVKYYGSEDSGNENLAAPDGYEFVGSNSYSIEIIRNENGLLTAIPDRVVFTVKPIGSQEPANPTAPTDV